MKVNKIAALVAMALSTSLLTGCDFYDSPPGDGGTDPGLPPIETPDKADFVVSSEAELIAAINDAETGNYIGLNTAGNFANVGTLVINKAITLISSNADGDIDDPAEAGSASTEQAIFSGAICIDIPTEAAEILRGGEQARISNIGFENVDMDSCGTGESTSNSIINIGKVGKDKTAVILDHLTFDGAAFNESTGDSDAWIYSRGLVDISNSSFTNKSESAHSILYLNCGSSASRGGSNSDPRGSIFSGNTFAMSATNANSSTKAATIGVPSNLGQADKNCATTFTENTFKNFTVLISEENTQSTALYDVFGDTTETDNTLENDGGTDPGTPGDVDHTVTNVTELQDAITNAAAGDIIGLTTEGSFADVGLLTLNKAVTLLSVDAEGNITDPMMDQATLSGAVCMYVPSDSVEDLKGTNQVIISNLAFSNVTISECGTADTQNAIINIGKVGKDKTPVELEYLTFNGEGFQETTGDSDAWVYSRGLVDISDSVFEGKSADAKNMVYLNCGSSTSRGGNNDDPRGSILTGNTFALAADNTAGTTKVATIGVPSNLGQENKNCAATFNTNTVKNFAELTSETDDIATALYDVFGDTVAEGNTLDDEGGTGPEPTYPENVEQVNTAIQAASAGDTITLGAEYDYSAGVITIDRAIKLVGAEGAKISGSACIDVLDGAAGAEISNLSFTNDKILEACGTTDNAKEAVINIQKVGEENLPIVLKDLIFDASNIIDQSQNIKKGAWIRSYGFINLTGSEFIGQSRNLQNDYVKLTCSAQEGKMGSLIDGNTFSITGDGTKETAAIKIGDSSSGAIKDADNENTCAVTVSNNTFTGYSLEITNNVGTSGFRDAAIFARLAEESTNEFTDNTFN
ncbi:hypothetical protein [Shewanella holmiensis]|uniref:Uncharacterized protein n=1 Tax=Shewanella holmiensis TaxID=2952222 RepID=A0A9X3AX97_9GAMM|nr:hypothetical protein [Shewanella holmiensis]MCT7943008.1 hypothetical protein [Shewanella holmiensis]